MDLSGSARAFPSTSATVIAWTARGSRLLVASQDGKVRLVDASGAASAEVATLPTNDRIRAMAGSDDGQEIVVGTESGDVFLASPKAPSLIRVAELHGPVGCLAVAQAGRAIVASGGHRVFVIDGETRRKFELLNPAPGASPIVGCSRSPAGDRFSFVDADGATWLKALDLGDVATSYIPVDPRHVPTVEHWRGLPIDLVH
jgi:WD40 repeat protein